MLLRMLLMVFALLLVPAYLVYTLWRGQSRSKLAWLVKLLSNGAYLLFTWERSATTPKGRSRSSLPLDSVLLGSGE
jgi:hypothetical protein